MDKENNVINFPVEIAQARQQMEANASARHDEIKRTAAGVGPWLTADGGPPESYYRSFVDAALAGTKLIIEVAAGTEEEGRVRDSYRRNKELIALVKARSLLTADNLWTRNVLSEMFPALGQYVEVVPGEGRRIVSWASLALQSFRLDSEQLEKATRLTLILIEGIESLLGEGDNLLSLAESELQTCLLPRPKGEGGKDYEGFIAAALEDVNKYVKTVLGGVPGGGIDFQTATALRKSTKYFAVQAVATLLDTGCRRSGVTAVVLWETPGIQMPKDWIFYRLAAYAYSDQEAWAACSLAGQLTARIKELKFFNVSSDGGSL